MSIISPSALEDDAEFSRLVSTATSGEQIKQYMRDRALALGKVTADPLNSEILHEVEPPATDAKIVRTVTLNGKTHTFEAATEAEANAAELAFMRALAPTTAAQPRDDAGRFMAEQGKLDEAAEAAEAARLIAATELELKFKRGEISAAEWLEKSGAIEQHLEAQGISVEALKAQTAEISESSRYEASWAEATTEFLRSPQGADWPGTPDSLARATDIITRLSQERPNMERESAKVEILSHVWAIMKRNDEQQNALANARTPQEIDDAIGKSDRAREGMMNRSSGVFGR